MKALILAGGYGTRLRPLTYTRPKHLLPIANRPHIEHVLELLQRHAIDEAVFLTSYLSGAFENTVAAAKARGFTMDVTHEEEPLGTAGALKHAQDHVGDETFFVFNGDVLTDVDLDALAGFHRDRDAEATIFLTPVEDPSRFGVVPTDYGGRVQGFIEKPPPGEAPTNLINAGIYVMEPTVLDRIPKGEVWSSEHQLFPELVSDGAGLYAIDISCYWLDIGTPASLLRANLDALSGAFKTDAVPTAGAETSVIAPNADVAESAKLTSAAVGDGAVIGEGAAVTRSVLLPGVRVGAGAVVEDSVLGENARVSDGARASGLIGGDDEQI
ncbi:MAG: sugar phosphate nucleotidyltransferase [Actinomycetota bacterium]